MALVLKTSLGFTLTGVQIPLLPFSFVRKGFEADLSADEEEEKSEGGRLRRSRASGG